jgi:hypothetical protein
MWARRWALGMLGVGLCGTGPAAAAEGTPDLNGATLGLPWALPLAGLLLSIALLPQLSPRLWHRHFGKVTAA